MARLVLTFASALIPVGARLKTWFLFAYEPQPTEDLEAPKKKRATTPKKNTPSKQHARPTKSTEKKAPPGNVPPRALKEVARVVDFVKPLCQPCDHGDQPWVHFIKWNQNYYTVTWLGKAEMETYPLSCARCKKSFVVKPKNTVVDADEVKVTSGSPGTC
jgi:hypothetical protein